MTVLHVNGIHAVDVQFCECSASERRVQMLRMGWWPASPSDPRTCATMALLRHFHLLNLQGKLPAYDFYRALELATDNTGLMRLPVSVKPVSYQYYALTFVRIVPLYSCSWSANGATSPWPSVQAEAMTSQE